VTKCCDNKIVKAVAKKLKTFDKKKAEEEPVVVKYMPTSPGYCPASPCYCQYLSL
jgi:hypothetical protein